MLICVILTLMWWNFEKEKISIELSGKVSLPGEIIVPLMELTRGESTASL